MKRKFSFLTKIISVFLAVTLCLPLFACTEKNNSSGISTREPLGQIPLPVVGEGLVDTGKYIVKADGTSEYKILIPELYNRDIEIAVSELQYAIKLTTGYDMAVTDVYQTGEKYLSIGDTPLYQANKTVVDGNGISEIESRVVTVGDNVIMKGYDSEYSLYATYEFMELSMGFKWYTYNVPRVVKADGVKLFQFDYSHEASVPIRSIFASKFSGNEDEILNKRRMKFGMSEDDYYASAHNLVGQLIYKPKYLESHPEWFTVPTEAMDAYDGIGQLCLTNEEMIEELIKVVKQIIVEKNFDCKYFMLGMEDNFNRCMGSQYAGTGKTCNCVELAKQTSPTGEESIRTGVFIDFANKIVRAVNGWIEEEHPDKNKVKFMMYAYYHNVEPPVKEVNGQYVVTDQRCIPDENLYISYAPLKNDYTYSFGDPRNTGINTMVRKWGAITKNLIFRTYGIAFGAPEYPFNDLLNMGGTYQIMFDYEYPGVIDEKSDNLSLARLKEYVSSQIWWGKGRNVDQIAFEFIDFYYAPVAKEFKQFYIDLKQFQTYQITHLRLSVGLQTSTYAYSDYWPFDAINRFNTQLDAIIDRLEPLKYSDPDAYKTYFDRVNHEKLWVYYIMCSHYKSYFNNTDFIYMVDYLEKYITEYQVQYSDAHLQQFESWRAN
ncbi:MAG: DUF4838 domain-containing protein [Clostridia bacterium]|nr:DUF4838 domain-containing protein [Clostridia bacterium]